MKTIKGPALFAQFAGDEPPFNSRNICRWLRTGVWVQIPSWDKRLFDWKAAESQTYCDEVAVKILWMEITELSTHLQGQLVVHPVYDEAFDGFAAEEEG